MGKLSMLQRLSREKILLRYLTAVERADLEAISTIWQRAARDALLEQMLLEAHDLYFSSESSISQEEKKMEDTKEKPQAASKSDWQEIISIDRPRKRNGARWLQAVAAVLVVCVLIGGFVGIQLWRTAQAVTPQQPGWCTVPSPGGSNQLNSHLSGVAAISASDAWIVGAFNQTDNNTSLAEHWDGTGWRIVPTPDLRSRGNYGLASVAAISANNVWAVGSILPAPQGFTMGVGNSTLIEHWDGTRWSVVPSPDDPAGTNELTNIFAISATDIWTVGETVPPQAQYGEGKPLLEHWDGNRWSLVQIPTTFHVNWLYSVAATSANDVWLLGGSEFTATPQETLIHWNGKQWSLAPGIGAMKYLGTLTAGHAHDIWLTESDVFAAPDPSHPSHPFFARWDGTRWSSFPAPHDGNTAALAGVLEISPTDLWVAEIVSVSGKFFGQLEHWDGTHWQAFAQQHANYEEFTQLAGAGGRLWAIGVPSWGPQENPISMIETQC